MPKKTFQVLLSLEARAELQALVSTGSTTAHASTHARILLKADEGADGPGWTDKMISIALDVGIATVARVRQTYAQAGLDAALARKATRRLYQRSLDGPAEAHLIALACGSPPDGAGRWTLRLLADRMVELEYSDTVSYETVRQTLKKTNLSPGVSTSGASHPKQMQNS